MFRILLIFAFLFPSTLNALIFDGKFIQGHFIIGKTQPETEIWIDKKRVETSAVRSHIERLHAENPKGGLVIQADKESTNEKLMAVLNAARAAGLREVAISTERM